MIAVNGYFDGSVIQTLEKLNARKNQRVIITLLDEVICEKKEVVVKGLLLFAETTFDKKMIKKLT